MRKYFVFARAAGYDETLLFSGEPEMGRKGIFFGKALVAGSFRRAFFILPPLLPLVLWAFCSSALADQFHYINTLIGDRAAGLGGAYTALSDDATGLYYNPAGIVHSSGRNLSASVNVYYHTLKTYKGVIGDLDWKRTSAALLPNYFGLIHPAGNVTLGFSVAVPDSGREDQDQIFSNVTPTTQTYIVNFHSDDNTYNVGPSVAVAFGDELSAGLTLYYYQRKWQFNLTETAIYVDGTQGQKQRLYDLTENGLRPVVGLMWRPAQTLSLGFSLSKIFLLTSTIVQQDTCFDTGVSENRCVGLPFLNVSRVTDRRKFPVQAVAGASYAPSSRLLLSMDVKYSTNVDDPVGGDRVAVVNSAFGAEYHMPEGWTLRGGLFSDLANTPDIVPGRAGQPEKADLAGVSMSIERASKNTSISLGGSFSSGRGKAQIDGSSNIQDLTVTSWAVFLSSSYSY